MKLLPWEYGVRNLLRSPLRLVLASSGAALVVLLVLTAGAFVQGMNGSLQSSGRAENVILLGVGSQESIERSEISPAAASQAAAGIPGIRQRMGRHYVSPEIYLQANFKSETQPDAPDRPAVLRGVTSAAFLVHPDVRIIEGRAPRTGHDELLVGRLAGVRMGLSDERLAPGRSLYLDGRKWTIVGRMAAKGTVMDAEIWCDLTDLQVASRRRSLSAVVLTLEDPDLFSGVVAFTTLRLDLELTAMRENQYYAVLSRFYAPVRVMVWITAGLIILGSVLGGLNTMYATFASRIREIASLQAIGYSRRAVLLSLVQESVLIAIAGTLAASAIALALLDGLAVRFSVGAFEMNIDGMVLAGGLAAGVLLGLVGAIPPAVRCLRPPIAEALRAG
jgi:putative ABC transport system permease protein